MSTSPTDGPVPSDQDAGRWADPSTRVSFDKRADAAAPTATEVPFDPYRFGAPDHPVPPEYAPPGYAGGYVPPPAMPSSGPQVGPYGQQPPPFYPPYGYAPPPYTQYPQPKTGNGKAAAALVLGILSIVFSVFSIFDLLLIIPAIVLGSLGLTDSKRTGSGRGMAIGGFVCATTGAVLAAALTIWLYPQVQRCVNDYPSNSVEYNNCIRDIVS